MQALRLQTLQLLQHMSAKKALKIICLVGAGLCVIVFAYLWSLGVFSGSSIYSERNAVVEEAVEKALNEKLAAVFDREGVFTDKNVKLISVDSQVAMYTEYFPKDKYKTADDVTEKDIERAISDYGNSITIEVKLEGNRIEFNPYKVIAFQCEDAIYRDMKIKPYVLQIFYYRAPEKNESESVMAYESQISGIYFGNAQSGVVNQTDLHHIVELDEELETKAKWYYGFKAGYIVFIALTVIALTTLLVVRTIKKKKRYKNSRNIDSL